MAIAQPSLIPSFCTRGFPEYPAAFCRPLPPSIHHAPDRAARAVGDVERPVRPHRHAHRSVLRSRRVVFPEAVRERLVAARRLAVLEGHGRDAVARPAERRPVPRAATSKYPAATLALGEL